jgi:hypothetical protein
MTGGSTARDLPRERIFEHEACGDEVRLRASRADFELHDA